MKNDLTCGVVRDLLPSYVEGLTSQETNQAVETHLASCPECTACRDAMKVPTEPAEQAKEVDYLKTVKRRNGRRVVLAVVCTVLLILAGFALKIFVIGTPAQEQELTVTSFSQEDGVLRLSIMTPYSATAYHGWKVEITGGVANISVRSVLVSPLFPDGGGTVEVPLDGVEEVRLCGRTVWQDGTAIQHETFRLYEARTPYVGDISALNRVASALNIQERLGSYTNSLHTSSRPYDWTLEFTTAMMEGRARRLDSDMQMFAPLMLALVENLDQVTWTYTDTQGEFHSQTITTENAMAILRNSVMTYQGEDPNALPDSIKDFAASPAAFQKLCDLCTWHFA